jgi:transketolase C-terminal domain/subunit
MKRVGVIDTFGESGQTGELMRKYGLTSSSIEEAVTLLMRTGR